MQSIENGLGAEVADEVKNRLNLQADICPDNPFNLLLSNRKRLRPCMQPCKSVHLLWYQLPVTLATCSGHPASRNAFLDAPHVHVVPSCQLMIALCRQHHLQVMFSIRYTRVVS